MGRPGSRVRGVSCSISICRSSFGVFNQRLFTRVAIAMGSLNRLRFPSPMANDKLQNGKCLRLRYNARGVSASGSEALPAFIFCGELMFERYTEKARRVIFFARYEASQFGSPYIETEHLLLGLLREDKALTNRFLRSHASIESIRKQIEGHTTIREKVSTSVDLPLSNECKRVLAYAAEEAERLSHKHIGTEHLLLGLLREEKCFAAEILHERGLRLSTIREELARTS